VIFQHFIGYSVLERVDVILIESIVLKRTRMVGFIKRISKELNDPYITYKTLYVAYATCVWSPHQEVHSAKIERIQHKFIRFAWRGLGWTTQPLPLYESRCLLLPTSLICCVLRVTPTKGEGMLD
jgi:hypothetical protein